MGAFIPVIAFKILTTKRKEKLKLKEETSQIHITQS